MDELAITRTANLLYSVHAQGNDLAPPWIGLSDSIRQGYIKEVESAIDGSHPLVDEEVPPQIITLDDSEWSELDPIPGTESEEITVEFIQAD